MATTADERSMHDGDVLVAPDERHPSRYTLSQKPGEPQVSWSTRADAEQAAKQFARRHRVDVWTHEHGTLVRLAAYRPARPATPGPRPAAATPARDRAESEPPEHPSPVRPTSPVR